VAIDFTPIDADPRVAPARAAYDEVVASKEAAQALRDAERAAHEARGAELKEHHTALCEAEKAARRRMQAAEGRLTRARKSGDPERIAAAEQRRAETREEWETASRRFLRDGRPLVHEMFDLSGAGYARLDGLLADQRAEKEASDALWDARSRVVGEYLPSEP
jgi:hypothetical protein